MKFCNYSKGFLKFVHLLPPTQMGFLRKNAIIPHLRYQNKKIKKLKNNKTVTKDHLGHSLILEAIRVQRRLLACANLTSNDARRQFQEEIIELTNLAHRIFKDQDPQ